MLGVVLGGEEQMFGKERKGHGKRGGRDWKGGVRTYDYVGMVLLDDGGCCFGTWDGSVVRTFTCICLQRAVRTKCSDFEWSLFKQAIKPQLFETIPLLSLGFLQMEGRLTFGIRHVINHVAVFDNVDNTTNQPLCSLWSVVDGD